MTHPIVVALSLGALAAALGAQSPPSSDSTWRDHDRAARGARERKDWQAAARHAEALDSLLYGNPRVTLAIARARANLGDTGGALSALRRYASMGLALEVKADSQLARLAETPEFASVKRRLDDNAKHTRASKVVATLQPHDFIAEGIAYDARRRRFLVSSIRYGTIVVVSADGVSRDFIDLKKNIAWAGMGLAIDSARDRLWVTSKWYPHTIGTSQADSGRSAVLSFDLASAHPTTRHELPRGTHEPGDICLADNGDLFVSDGRAGTISVIRTGGDSLSLLVPPGELISPQGCAVDTTGGRRQLLVADYALGVASVDVATGKVRWLPRSSSVAAVGIDGMLLDGDRLIAVQNGVEPNRVVALHLDADHESISSIDVVALDPARIREPTHVTMMGGAVAFVGNGGFSNFDVKTGHRRPDAKLRAPRLLVTPIDPPAIFPKPPDPSADTAAVQLQLLALDWELARSSKAASLALLDAAAPDAPILLPEHPILRAADARPALNARYGGPERSSYLWKPVHAVVGGDGRFGCTVGTSTYRPADSSATHLGSYITCWQRPSTDTPWRIVGHQRHEKQSDASKSAEPPKRFPRSVGTPFGAMDVEGALAADEAFARRGALPAGPGPAFAAYVAADGLLVMTPTFPRGPRGMLETFEGYPASRVLLWHPDRAFGGGSGGLAFTAGYSLTRDRGASPGKQSAGKYFSVWRRSATGRWEFILDQGTPGR